MLNLANGKTFKLELAGGLYHVTSRGDRRENIYDNDDDREKWLEILGNTCRRFNWRCHVYCLMDNHYHLVIETAEANHSKGMRQLMLYIHNIIIVSIKWGQVLHFEHKMGSSLAFCIPKIFNLYFFH